MRSVRSISPTRDNSLRARSRISTGAATTRPCHTRSCRSWWHCYALPIDDEHAMRFAPASTRSLPTRAKGTQIARVAGPAVLPKIGDRDRSTAMRAVISWFRCGRWRDVAGEVGGDDLGRVPCTETRRGSRHLG
jgi:hypothetical protein